jgi:hypothetical protein
MRYQNVAFTAHVVTKMFQRGISREDVLRVLDNFEIVEDYPNDTPYPSYLILGFVNLRPFHLVVSNNHIMQTTIVITTYRPDPDKWEVDWKTRK